MCQAFDNCLECLGFKWNYYKSIIMGDKVTFKHNNQQCYGIIVGFVTIYNVVNAIVRLDTGRYIEVWLDCIKYCE